LAISRIGGGGGGEEIWAFKPHRETKKKILGGKEAWREGVIKRSVIGGGEKFRRGIGYWGKNWKKYLIKN